MQGIRFGGRGIRVLLLAVFAALIATGGCAAPASFIETQEANWATIELREDLKYDQAWEAVSDRVVRRFDLEVAQRQDGYLRTSWLYSWTGEMTTNYRVRVTAKFNPERTKVDIKSEAEYGGNNNWHTGTDTRLLQTMKQDIMGTVGRTTR